MKNSYYLCHLGPPKTGRKKTLTMTPENQTPPVPEEQVDGQPVEDAKVTAPAAPQEETPAEVAPAEAKKAPAKTTASRKKTAAPASAPEEDEPAKEEAVDFSEEEADLAANAPEFDLGEETEAEQQHEEAKGENADYADKSKAELVAALEELLATKPVQSIRRDAESIKIAFYKAYRAEVEQLRRMFVEAGGTVEDFVPPADESEQRLKTLFSQYRDKRNEYMAGLDQEKEANHTIKLGIIDELKELIGSSETLNATFNAFRELQKRWKETGPVPQTQLKDLWETYNLHVENFYNFIKINKELRDLDLKKNYEAKLQLCEEAEALILDPSVINAFHKLQKLHEQWRETGPVSAEYKDQLWERFREASTKINKRHQEHFEHLKDEQKRNLELKVELCVKAEELTGSPYTTRKEWNKASDLLTEVQKVWKTIGFAPKRDNTKVYERFRNACDKFFEGKRNFYLQTKQEMENNFTLKNEICAAAEALRESEEWKKTTDELIALQKKWKEIGPVSRRHADAIWKRFRGACDAFFERKTKHFSTVDAQYEENLTKKRQLLEELKTFTIETRDKGFEAIKELQRRWSEIGFIPIKQKDAIQAEYRAAVDAIFAQLRGNEREHRMERFKHKISNMSEGAGDKKMRYERDRLYNKMKQMESDIALLENNIGFFSKSKNAESMIRDVKAKIEQSKEEMAALIEKINLIDQQQAEN